MLNKKETEKAWSEKRNTVLKLGWDRGGANKVSQLSL